MSNQFESLQGWIPEVLNAIKKDIKTEHLSSDPVFYKTYFGNRPQNRLTTDEIFAAYEKELLKGNADLADWIVNRWVFKHGDVYSHFAERVGEINPNFEEIQSFDEPQSEKILKGALESLGAVPVFLFSILNGVVFPDSIIQKLRAAAEKEKAQLQKEETVEAERQALEQIVAQHQREMNRLHEKYENRVAGIQKKYTTDTEALKKQIRALQQKLKP
jgi:hypothetical protein